MIYRIIQEKSNLGAVYEIYSDEEKKYTAVNEFKNLVASILVKKDDQIKYKMLMDYSKDEYYQKMSNKVHKYPLTILDQNDQFCGCLGFSRNGFFDYLETYEFVFKNEFIKGYLVGLGKNGTYISLYSNDCQVALIEKDIRINDNKDTYTIYALDNYSESAILFCLYYDYLDFKNKKAIAYKTKRKGYVFTTSKRQKSMYDHTFKNQFSNR